MLVVVNKQFQITVRVQINDVNRVAVENSSVINDSSLNERSINLGDSVNRDSLVKELSGIDNDFIGVLISELLGNTEADIRTLGDNVLSPRSSIETTFGVLKPDKSSTTWLGIGFGGNEIFTAVSVHIDPLSHMVEVPICV